ncbi:CDP-alcohol phosphatidyltransferase family protein [Nocardioides immobilis]|uniref:CDP-alcohol phosphatidyltransferase family protein n=2 Tax=Nocardioides immobilis TaxID=2049295 RepID=A0A417XYA4_9ACTN|nr:CDP-alcohol phosphatidyltransferase family protein [Nocardioides immobilis]
MLRLAGVPLFLWLVLGPEADGWALAVLMVSGVTDFLDGWLARKLDQQSALGQILDPVADRLYILAVVVGLALRDIIPWWLAASLPLRDLLLWGLVPLLRTRGYSALPVHFLGKAATFNLLYAFPLLLLGDGEGTVATLAQLFGWALALWGIGLYWWAGVLYAWQVRKLLATTEPRSSRAGGP